MKRLTNYMRRQRIKDDPAEFQEEVTINLLLNYSHWQAECRSSPLAFHEIKSESDMYVVTCFRSQRGVSLWLRADFHAPQWHAALS